MSTDRRLSTILTSSNHGGGEEEEFRDIHALTPPAAASIPRSRGWETASDATNSSENFTSISREFNALVLAGSTLAADNAHTSPSEGSQALEMIGEGEEEANPLAIVVDSQQLSTSAAPGRAQGGGAAEVASVQRVKREEVEAKISAWQNAKVAKVNNRFKREDAVINGWEAEQLHKSTSRMKRTERRLEEKRAKAMEKMQNDVAKAHRKAEERRASAESRRGTKIARILQVADLMRAIGKPPSKRSFF